MLEEYGIGLTTAGAARIFTKLAHDHEHNSDQPSDSLPGPFIKDLPASCNGVLVTERSAITSTHIYTLVSVYTRAYLSIKYIHVHITPLHTYMHAYKYINT